jgi:hypothetical protein
MPKASVSDYLERARGMAALADKKSGGEKKRLLEIAEAWLKLADDAALEAAKPISITGSLPQHPRAH